MAQEVGHWLLIVDLDSIPEHSVWDLWWIKRCWTSLGFVRVCRFTPAISHCTSPRRSCGRTGATHLSLTVPQKHIIRVKIKCWELVIF